VYAVASTFTVLVMLASAAIPAWRALRVDPAVALRWQ
jgi:ABC-type antimicrobial peptide transport system permease subunit